jgi:hypothetical protein
VVLSHSMTLAVLPDKLPDEESRNSASEETQEGKGGSSHKLAGLDSIGWGGDNNVP